jgi:hypothetical protein
METLYIEAERTTLRFYCVLKQISITLQGIRFLQTLFDFYEPVLDWFNEFLKRSIQSKCWHYD